MQEIVGVINKHIAKISGNDSLIFDKCAVVKRQKSDGTIYYQIQSPSADMKQQYTLSASEYAFFVNAGAITEKRRPEPAARMARFADSIKREKDSDKYISNMALILGVSDPTNGKGAVKASKPSRKSQHINGLIDDDVIDIADSFDDDYDALGNTAEALVQQPQMGQYNSQHYDMPQQQMGTRFAQMPYGQQKAPMYTQPVSSPDQNPATYTGSQPVAFAPVTAPQQQSQMDTGAMTLESLKSGEYLNGLDDSRFLAEWQNKNSTSVNQATGAFQALDSKINEETFLDKLENVRDSFLNKFSKIVDDTGRHTKDKIVGSIENQRIK